MNNPNCGKCGMMNHSGYCQVTACIYPCETGRGGYINKPVTNADRIRAMTDEEMAEWIAGAECPRRNCVLADDCEACWLNWLKREAAE